MSACADSIYMDLGIQVYFLHKSNWRHQMKEQFSVEVLPIEYYTQYYTNKTIFLHLFHECYDCSNQYDYCANVQVPSLKRNIQHFIESYNLQ